MGLEEHDKLEKDKTPLFKKLFAKTETGYPIAVKLEVNLNERTEKDVKEAFAYFIDTAHFEDTTMQEVTKGLAKLSEKAGNGKIEVSVRRKDPQQIGNCSYRCLSEAVRSALGVDSYRNFKINLIDNLAENYKQMGSEDEAVWTSELSAIREKTVLKQRLT